MKNNTMHRKFSAKNTALYKFIIRHVVGQKQPALQVGKSILYADWKIEDLKRLVDKLVARNIVTPEQLAERALRGADFEVEAKQLGVTPTLVAFVYQRALETLDPAVRCGLEKAVAQPKGLGGLDVHDPRFIEARKRIPQISKKLLKLWRKDDAFRCVFTPNGPIAAVDHRSSLGQARDQNPRGTCYAFGATAVMESLEYLRDRRPGPRDLSEELLIWYYKGGQLYALGNGDGAVALGYYGTYGSCEEEYFPYYGNYIPTNNAQVPAPDDAMDRAHFFTSETVVSLPTTGDANDIQVAKDVLKAGRCIVIACYTYDGDPLWDIGAGMISLPSSPDDKDIVNQEQQGSHYVAIIGYIDRDDLSQACEGGYFIIRNSWGTVDNGSSNTHGPEYGGHLLMPYGWYRRYIRQAATCVDSYAILTTGGKWRAEYYKNQSLQGMPAKVAELDDIDLDWGKSGPVAKDHFSARFTQVRRFRPGWWRFKLCGDDGVRLWIDDRLVINAWHDQAATEYVEEHYLTGGDHVLRVEYYENTGLASVCLQVEPVQFHFELFANADLSGFAANSFDDTMTDLEWRHVPPVTGPGLNGVFSLRATGTKHFAGGIYRFHAQHTGGCRIWVNNALVLDDWSGGAPSGAPVVVSDGDQTVKVEFKNLATIPAADKKGYYRATLDFDWSEETWQVSIYNDQLRETMYNEGWSNADIPNSQNKFAGIPDSNYEAYRTNGLTGLPVFEYRYPAMNNNASSPNLDYYSAQDGLQDGLPLLLQFANLMQFKNGNPLAAAVPNFPPAWFGAHIRRRIYINKAGYYQFTFPTIQGNRLLVDGKQCFQTLSRWEDAYQGDVFLDVGVHDIAIEFESIGGSGSINFQMAAVVWNVDYFSDTNLTHLVASKTVDCVDAIINAAPSQNNFSVRASRTISFLPVGRYRLQVKSDDGVRVKVAGQFLIDAWFDPPPPSATGDWAPKTSYWAFVEHRGGPMPIEIDYYHRPYQGGGDATLEFALLPAGFFGEYYRGVLLEKPARGSTLDFNVPIAYRFVPTIDFDWGQGSPLPRLGSELFSARWTGPVMLPVGRWKIAVTSDDGVRVFLDGRLIIDRWKNQSATESDAIVDLVGRTQMLTVEYYQRTGKSCCRMTFQRIFPAPDSSWVT